jgi:hypothetical protein
MLMLSYARAKRPARETPLGTRSPLPSYGLMLSGQTADKTEQEDAARLQLNCHFRSRLGFGGWFPV